MTDGPRESWLPRGLVALLRLALGWPRGTIALAVLLAVGCVSLAATRLEFRTNRLDLLSPHSEFNRRWLDYLSRFGDGDDAVLVVTGARGQVQTALAAIADALASDTQWAPGDVFCRLDLSHVEPHGIHLATPEQVERIAARVTAMPRGADEWRQLDLAAMIGQAGLALGRSPDPESLDQTLRLLRGVEGALSDPPEYHSPWPSSTELASDLAGGLVQGREWLLSDDGHMGFALVRIRRINGVPDPQRLAALRDVQRQVADSHPYVRIGLTGVPVLEHDEMSHSQADMGLSSALSIVGVGVLFAATFGGLRHSLAALACLAIGMGWTMGYITLGVGHLNILSVAFGAILIGLGIDFSVHVLSHYLDSRHRGVEIQPALEDAIRQVGPGIVTGGLTTALAFATASLTDFVGVAELGLIAGGGVLLCMLATLLVLPPLFWWADHGGRGPLPPPLPAGVLCRVANRAPLRTALVFALLTAGAATGLPRVYYDHNLLNLQARGVESVQWEHELARSAGRSVWFALVLARDDDELARVTRDCERLPSVERTESLAPLLYHPDPRRERALQAIRDWSAGLAFPPAGNVSETPPPELVGRVAGALGQLRLAASGHGELAAAAEHLALRLETPDGSTLAGRLEDYQRVAVRELQADLLKLSAAVRAAPPTVDELPPELASRYIGNDGTRLLRVYARGSIWDMDALSQFVGELEGVAPQCTGHPVQTYYASRQMQRGYLHAAIYSLLAVGAVLMLDLRSIRQSLLAMLPMGLGLLQLLGLLGLLGIPLNAANMIVLPLILGIGIDDGVHVMHDWRHQLGERYRMSNSTAAAVVLTSATTMVGFGSMMVARHQGLRSLGQVLTLGVFCCLINSLFVLPALLAVWRYRPASWARAAR